MLTVLHLTSSTFFGGPERQMLGLAQSLAGSVRTLFVSFEEGGRCEPFLEVAQRWGFRAESLTNDTPHLVSAVKELVVYLKENQVEVLCAHGYKAGLLGRLAARRVKVPIIAVSRGWTYASPKVRLYEYLDRMNLRWMDRVVCVSRGQAEKVRCCGVPSRLIVTIPNAICAERFATPDLASRLELERLFPQPVRLIVGAAGRLSPEKGFEHLVEAAATVLGKIPDVGFILFGEGTLHDAITAQIASFGLSDRFVLAGFRRDFDSLLPHLDLIVQSSVTEGMPNVLLEASAAGIPVVATAVGGTPEVVVDGRNGYLVPARGRSALARSILDVLGDRELRQRMGAAGRNRMREEFTFGAQGKSYLRLFSELLSGGCSAGSTSRVELSEAEGTRHSHTGPVPAVAALDGYQSDGGA
jgi:glycosyltransferase involved in cell wall biosynthesis